MVNTMAEIQGIAIYNRNGNLIKTARNIREVVSEDFLDGGIRSALKSGKIYKNHFFRYFIITNEPLENIEVPYLCIIDGLKFMKQNEVAEYCNVTKQAVSSAKQHSAIYINGKVVEWRKE